LFFLRNFEFNAKTMWRCSAIGLCFVCLVGLFFSNLQPALARPFAQAADTLTPTDIPTNTQPPTITLTTSLTPTDTLPPTATLTPTITQTKVGSLTIVINEIAWMGTTFDKEAEWIELYNQGSQRIVLDGWSLVVVGGFAPLKLNGIIEADGYFLLAREGHIPFINANAASATSTPPTTTAIVDQPIDINQTFSGPLSNDGMSLELIAPDGSIIDSANDFTRVNGTPVPAPWPAGNKSAPFCSMERSSATIVDSPGAWFTGNKLGSNGRDMNHNLICGSPGRKNWAYSVTATATVTPSRTRTVTPVPPGPQGTATRAPVKTPTRTPIRATPSSIVINEFLTQPRSDWNGDGKVNNGDEYIEIINLSSQPVSIAGWRLDDQEGDSSPYTIESITMQPGVRKVFFASQTSILLGNGGDSVRLFKSSGQISDAFSYGVVKVADQTWCRLPEGSITWVFGCIPTVGEANRMGGGALTGNYAVSALCLSKTIPFGVLLAECNLPGLSMWNRALWDAFSQKFPLFFNVETNLYILE